MNPTRKLYLEERICGTPVVKACHIFAVINAVIVGIALVVSFLGWLMFLFWRVQTSIRETGEAIVILLFLSVAMAVAIAGVFAMLLLVGIRKKKPGFVMAYLFYGVVVEIGLIVGTLSFGVLMQPRSHSMDVTCYLVIALIANGSCVLYGFVLWLLRKAHAELRRRTTNVDAQMICLS